MSRRLTGRLVANPNGTFTVSVPAARGASKRVQKTFQSRKAAERWNDDAILAIKTGQPLPEAEPEPTRSANHAGTRLKTIGYRYIEEHFVEDEAGEVDREAQVRGHVDVMDAYFRHPDRRWTVESVTRLDAKQMFRDLLKRDAEPVQLVPSGLDPDALVTRAKALALLAQYGSPVSLSTFKRAVRSGRLSAADRSDTVHRFRVADLFSADVRLFRSATAREAAVVQRYSHSTLGDIHRLFLRVIEYAQEQGIQTQPGVLRAKLPRNRATKVKTRPLTLHETARLARHMHVVHQVVLWTLRVLGLRISEAYGVLVEDVIDFGPGEPGVLKVLSQGGQKYRRRAGDDVVVTDKVDHVKWHSNRVLVVPPALMDLFRILIAAFHTDDAGRVRTGARLIPGLANEDAGGQAAFRASLETAATDEGLDLRVSYERQARDCAPVLPAPHHLRKSFATELGDAKTEHVETYLGHNLGERVIHEHYMLQDPELRAQRKIAALVAKQIEIELSGSLLVPTDVSCTSGNQPALTSRGAEIDAVLAEAGWLVAHDVDGEGALTVDDAAALLGVTAAQVREYIREGRLAATESRRVGERRSRYMLNATDVLEFENEVASGSDMRELAEELDISYDTVRQFINRSPDLAREVTAGRRDQVVPAAVAEKVREYFVEQEKLADRSVRAVDVARDFGVSVAALDVLVKRGVLVEDSVRFHGGFRAITRESLASYEPGGRRRRRR